MRKSKRRYFIMLVILIMLALIVALIPTLSKYLTKVEGESTINIARWEIKVNSQSIRENKDISGVLTPVFAGSDHVAQDVIAPSSEGYFELNIDFTNADVSCTYKISFKTLESNVKDLIITSYIAPDGTTINVSNTTGNANNVEINGSYTYGNNAATNIVQHYKINVKWNDDVSTQTMSNADDTAATIPATDQTYATTKMNVLIGFTQSTS